MPFFLIADLITYLSGAKRDGFSQYYKYSIDFASTFYLVFGLLFLYKMLYIYTNFNKLIISTSLCTLFIGTNLFYYSIIETGMSHVYSFFLFSTLLYLTITNTIKTKHLKLVLICIIISLIILIRPLNAIILIIPFIIKKWESTKIITRLHFIKIVRFISISCLIFLSILFPQLLYWKYTFGKYFIYSYQNEGFANLLSPYLLEVIFSPKNGLLPYSLIFIGMIAGLIILYSKNKLFCHYIIFTILLLIYLTASWHDWSFGCGLGMRNMVEYYSLLSIPLCYTMNFIFTIKSKIIKILLIKFILLLTLINLKINYHYYGCYFLDTWIWTDYFKTLFYPLK